MIKIQPQAINNVKLPVNFKAMPEKEDLPQNTDKIEINPLNTPMETVGRSQVNFKAKKLSTKDLNYLADNTRIGELSKRELTAFKDATLKTLKDFRSNDFKELFDKKLDSSMDEWMEFNYTFLDNVKAIDEKVDAEKLLNVMRGM